MFAFFITGFADLVGISTSYIKADFGLSYTFANFLPMMVFFCFAVSLSSQGVSYQLYRT